MRILNRKTAKQNVRKQSRSNAKHILNFNSLTAVIHKNKGNAAGNSK